MTSHSRAPRRQLHSELFGSRRSRRVEADSLSTERRPFAASWRGPTRFPATGRATTVAALSVIGFSTLLAPWMAAGSTHRSAYSLAQALSATGMLNGAWERVLYLSLVALPVLVALVCVA